MFARLLIICFFIVSIQVEADQRSAGHQFVSAPSGAVPKSIGPYTLKNDKLLTEWGSEKLPQHFEKVFPGQELDFAFMNEEKFKKELLSDNARFLTAVEIQEYRKNVESLTLTINNLVRLMNGESNEAQKDLYFRDFELPSLY